MTSDGPFLFVSLADGEVETCSLLESSIDSDDDWAAASSPPCWWCSVSSLALRLCALLPVVLCPSDAPVSGTSSGIVCHLGSVGSGPILSTRETNATTIRYDTSSRFMMSLLRFQKRPTRRDRPTDPTMRDRDGIGQRTGTATEGQGRQTPSPSARREKLERRCCTRCLGS